MSADHGPLPVVFDDTIDTDKSQYLIQHRISVISSQVGGGNGLVEIYTDFLVILTGLDAGDVHVHVELHESEPPLDLDTWDEIVDVSFRAEDRLCLEHLFGGGPENLPDLDFQGPGNYRIRICARRRDEAEQTYESVEFHAIYVWPDKPRPIVSHQHRDAVGERRREAYRRRAEDLAKSAPEHSSPGR